MQRPLPPESGRGSRGDQGQLRLQIGLGQRRAHPRIMVERRGKVRRRGEMAQRVGVGREIVEYDQRLRRSEEHTSELQSLMRISYAVFCLKKKQDQPQQSSRSNNKKRAT